MKAKKQYLIVDAKKHRRHSAPENLHFFYTPKGWTPSSRRNDHSRASVSDFSVLLESQFESGSGSSLELDTSNWSRDLSVDNTNRNTPTDSYQDLPAVHCGRAGADDDHFRGFGSWPMWRNILLSQAIAGSLAVMDISNGSLRRNACSLTANGQNLPHYILLGVLWTSKLALGNGGDIVRAVKYSGLRYLFLSLLHVEANYLLVSSFRHDTYLGNQVIDSVAAALCVIVAYVCLEVRFRLVHASGFMMSMVGSVGLCVANIIDRNHSYEDVLLGEVLRIASGICLALNSIAQEIIVKSIDFGEYMGMVGLMGSIVCGFQALASETIVPRTSACWAHLLAYSGAHFLFNSLTPKCLHEMGATGLHLALIASACYSHFISAAYRGDKWGALHPISFGVTLTGSILFFSKRTVIGTESFFPVRILITKGTETDLPAIPAKKAPDEEIDQK